MTDLHTRRQAFLDQAAALDRQVDEFRAAKQYRQSGKAEKARWAVLKDLAAFDAAHPDIAAEAYDAAVARAWARLG